MVLKTNLGCEKTICSMMSPCENHLEIIRKDIGETEARLENAESLLIKWIDCQQHFPKNYDRSFVRNFLRGSKFDLEKTKSKLEAHFSAKSNFPGIYNNRIVDQDLVDTLNAVVLFPLPKLSKDGNRIFIFKMKENSLTKIDFNLCFKIFFMIYDLLLKNHNPAAKEIAVFDCEHSSPTHVMSGLVSIKSHMQLLRQCYAIRLKEIHVLKAHAAVEKSIALLKPVLHDRIRNSFIFHRDAASLAGRLGGDVLPRDYGGACGSLAQLAGEWTAALRENEPWFRQQEAVRMDAAAAVRRGRAGCLDGHVGIHGSFRRLEID